MGLEHLWVLDLSERKTYGTWYGIMMFKVDYYYFRPFVNCAGRCCSDCIASVGLYRIGAKLCLKHGCFLNLSNIVLWVNGMSEDLYWRIRSYRSMGLILS